MVHVSHLYSADWFSGADGPQLAMFRNAHEKNHKAYVVSISPRNGFRSYASYQNWRKAVEGLGSLGTLIRHHFELIPQDVPCKLYFDFDKYYADQESSTGVKHGDVDINEFMEKVEKALLPILRKATNQTNQENDQTIKEAFVWMDSSTKEKFSLHLVIHLVLDDQLWLAPNSVAAGYFNYLMLNQSGEDGHWLQEYTDAGVYTKNRLMRMLGSSKKDKSNSLKLISRVCTIENFEKSTITWCDSYEKHAIFAVPQDYLQGKNNLKHKLFKKSEIEAKLDCDEGVVIRRMEHLIRDKVHATVFLQQTMDANGIVRFNYSDRKERCYTSEIHEGNMNFSCSIDLESQDIYMHCFSAKCNKKPKLLLGSLNSEEQKVWEIDAVEIREEYLSTKMMDLQHPLGKIIEKFSRKEISCLGVRSPMGTGKTKLLEEMFELHNKIIPEDATVLLLVYRRTLSRELMARLHSCGFQNYLKIKEYALYDRKRYPRIICQLDSMDRLCEYEFDVPQFDYIVIDEVESVLNHIQSQTLKKPYQKMIKICKMLQGETSIEDIEEEVEKHSDNTPSILLLDALYGMKTFALIKELGIKQALVVNRHQNARLKRDFEFANWHTDEWIRMIVEDLTQNKNIAVVTLSQTVGERLKEIVLLECEGIKILFYSSKMDDRRKADFENINDAWKDVNLLIYTPTIESGIDCSLKDHFYRVYGYVVGFTACARALAQMVMRVRYLICPVIKVCVGRGISMSDVAKYPKANHQTIVQKALWMNRRVQQYSNPLEEAADTIREMGPVRLLPYWPAVNTIARVEAELVNSSRRFLDEFKALAIEGGHSYLFTKLSTDEYEAYTLDPKNAVDANFQYKASEYESLIEKEQNEQATEEDKKLLQRYRYLRYWNVQWCDEVFVKEHPINKDDTARSLLKCLVTKKTQFLGFTYDRSNETLVAAGMLREVLETLGLRHIFDSNHVVDTSKISTKQLEELKNSEFIKSYFRACSVFAIRDTKKRDKWTANSIMQAIVVALRRAKLKMTNKRRHQTVDGKREYYYVYQLEKESVEKASEMVLLSIKEAGGKTDWKSELYSNVTNFMTTLDQDGYKHYLKYLSVPDDLSTNMLELTLKEESTVYTSSDGSDSEIY